MAAKITLKRNADNTWTSSDGRFNVHTIQLRGWSKRDGLRYVITDATTGQPVHRELGYLISVKDFIRNA